MFNRQAPQPIHHTTYHLERLMEDFGLHQKIERNYTDKTVENYKFWLTRFIAFAGNIMPDAIDRQLVKDYRRYLAELGILPATQNYHLIALRSFLKYLALEGYNTLNPTLIEIPRHTRRQVEFLEPDEAERLLEAVDTSDIVGIRDRALLELMYSSGMRVSEVVSLNRRQITDRRAIAIRGKGGKDRLVYYTERAAEWLESYLETRYDDNPALFVDIRDHMRLTPRHIQRLVKQCATLAKIDKTVTPHTLRHSFATNIMANGADIRSVQDLLGHSSIATTMIYTHTTNAGLQRTHERFFRQ